MDILIVSQYFWPESFRVNDFASSLVKLGHRVTVLTGKPNYPAGKIYGGYKFLGYQKESYNEVSVIRVPLIPRGNSNGFMLAVNYLSFILFSCIYVLFHSRRYDVTLTYGLSPVFQAYAAVLYKKLYKVRTFLWIQDLWPESVKAAGRLNSRYVYGVLEKMVVNVYSNVDGIFCQSPVFSDSILKKGVQLDKIFYAPNWAEDLYTNKDNINNEKYSSLMPKGFIVMFAGNIGESQDFDSVIKAAIILRKYQDVKWVIIGDGRKKKDVVKQISDNDLIGTVFLLGKFPVEDMPSMFVHADVMLTSLKDEYIFSLTIPSKIQSYMAFGKPILTMLNGIGSKVVKDADCGYTAHAGDYESLAKNVLLAKQADKNILAAKGQNGYQYYMKNFAKDIVISNIISAVNKFI
jgi:glycosyltransferase involved in cell wall biosynthesis